MNNRRMHVAYSHSMVAGEPGAGKRMPPDQVFGQAQVLADSTHLVFEQVAQRFDQFETEFGRPAAALIRPTRGLRIGMYAKL